MRRDEFIRRRRALSERLAKQLLPLFTRPRSWRDQQAEAFVELAVPLVQGSQRTLAAVTAAYIAAQAGGRIAIPGVPDTAAVNLRRGVDPREVYRRPFVTVWSALAQGRPLTEAVALGETRLREIAECDLQQTYAHASRAALSTLPTGARPRYWRRVLVGPGDCAMCVIASTQRYTIENLNPIHPGCNCTVDGIFGPDPGQVIEPELLEKVHDAVEQLTGSADRGARAPDYRQIVVEMVREHGELGGLLTRPRDRFTAVDDLSS